MPITQFRGPHRFLSNFYTAHVQYLGLAFPTVEHAYQAGANVLSATGRIISARY